MSIFRSRDSREFTSTADRTRLVVDLFEERDEEDFRFAPRFVVFRLRLVVFLLATEISWRGDYSIALRRGYAHAKISYALASSC